MLENDGLDILGTQPSLHKLYTQICSIYPVPDPCAHDSIGKTLRRGLDRLGESFPWLSGNVVNEGASEGVTGTFRIIPTVEIPLVVKDYRSDPSAPTMDTLRKARFPMTMLDESIFAPCMTLNLPGKSVGLVSETGPVFAVQASFVSGGLILTFVGQHNVMDMTGQASIINWLSTACHGCPFSKEDLSIGNMDKTKSVTLFEDSWDPDPELDIQMAKPVPEPNTANNDASAYPYVRELPSSSWRYVEFPATSLHALKSLAMETRDPECGFISTDDTVCAFIWRHISRAREARLDPQILSTFARALDARESLDLPSTYPGAISNMSYNQSSLQDLHRQPLGIIASQLRRQLDPKVRDLAHDTRALATLLSRSVDKSKILITAAVDPSSGISLSSWAKINLHTLDFNLALGKPEAVRRPRFMPVESLMYIMPKALNGALAVALCLRDEDWERLNANEEWREYVTYIG
ncbi:transferase family-domain-containing protein [Aspergillus carlsbadensis]|nr:transferase family-domain-containing protein [Aspergillus carlsbadensis]